MNGPQVRGSLVTNQLENHAALVGLHIDFSVFKVQPPSEYQDIGQSLSARRRNDADEGQSHLTAAQLGVLFNGLVPEIPNLIRAYGLRCSEIANSPTFNPKGTSQHGLFANEVGADGTAIWAAATSGDSAIAVHLLGCMLSRMWDAPEAISIWMQLIAERKQTLAASGNPIESATSRSITLTRDQIASWHTSIQAWRRTADEANARRQKQLLLIIDNLGIPVNTKSSLSESVLAAWIAAMVTVDNLVSGKPQRVQTGAPLLGLAAWHLYPDMIVFGRGRNSTAKQAPQHDPLVQQGGVLTLGIQDIRRSGDGIYWSLPLAYLRYYGQAAHSEACISSRTSRTSMDELVYVALGSLIRRWLAHAEDIQHAAELLVKLNDLVDISGNLGRDGTWISLLSRTARSFLTADPEAKAAKLQLIKCGRRRYPLFIDDPAADTIFGLSAPRTLFRLLPGNSARVALLRHIAQDFSDHRTLMVIQCKRGNPKSIWELASKTLISLRALQTASALYTELQNATVELKTAEQPLHEHQWIPEQKRGHRHFPFAGFLLTREQMFACISKFESGGFNFHPSAMNGVLAISSGNSLFVASGLLQDPCNPRSPYTIERVVGNLGKTGMALLVCPAVPQIRPLSDDVRLVNHHPFDGGEEDSFRETSLHISYTEWELPIDIGARGKRDVEAHYIEAAIGLYDRGKWVADLNILNIFKHRLSRIVPPCTHHREHSAPIDETSKFVTIDSWEELLDSPTEIGVVRARGNWQARLAAAAISIQRGHETRIVPEKTCWSCCLALKRIPPLNTKSDEDMDAQDDVFGIVPFLTDEEGSDSETDEKVNITMRKNVQKDCRPSFSGGGNSSEAARERNIVYIL
ncbi:hypothetical protein K458DRAFT_371176 [Lentithecium fluviatile CBS 122367]|uniref:Uncharacterized protein n=1 Tax=Lentithecium fluviatile CBS 122367 TaxID=1168545 RepID=A0A6G1IUY2_9PLEO|nr:hypothetical protein K458DRAFT_371176 [Lentithecium fluviatile CBS 122367]